MGAFFLAGCGCEESTLLWRRLGVLSLLGGGDITDDGDGVAIPRGSLNHEVVGL